MKRIKHLFLALLLAPLGVQAASVNIVFQPSSSGPLVIGDSVDVDVLFNYDNGGHPGHFLGTGHFNLFFDQAIVSLTGITNSTAPNAFNFGSQDQSTPGMVENVGFSYNALMGPGLTTGSYHAGTFTFQAIANGVSSLSMVEFPPDGFYLTNWDALNNGALGHSLSFSGGSIQVAPVPLPAAAWLLLSGLGAFGFIGRRRALKP